MALAAGDRLGLYEIVAPLGAGGMGEVYRARDTRLDRVVAIKVLPEAFAEDPERLARFEREARLLASLNHPNIAALHGLEIDGGRRFIAMEFVDGVSLAQRLASGALPMDEALDVARQVATALEAAHDGGIVHRDLKPGNVMVRPDGTVKVLDFGLAKGVVGSASDSSLSMSPTRTNAMTGDGMILGTAAYMSPEQARGKPVDRRADIWAFGCVLFECLTGRQAFEGETVSDLIASILKGGIEWTALPAATPPRVRTLLERCLERDARQRLRDIGEARLVLEQPGSAEAPAAAPAVPARAPLPIAALVGGALLLAAIASFAAGRSSPRHASRPRGPNSCLRQAGAGSGPSAAMVRCRPMAAGSSRAPPIRSKCGGSCCVISKPAACVRSGARKKAAIPSGRPTASPSGSSCPAGCSVWSSTAARSPRSLRRPTAVAARGTRPGRSCSRPAHAAACAWSPHRAGKCARSCPIPCCATIAFRTSFPTAGTSSSAEWSREPLTAFS
jgi:predicted Ser/Thr protein kinase